MTNYSSSEEIKGTISFKTSANNIFYSQKLFILNQSVFR